MRLHDLPEVFESRIRLAVLALLVRDKSKSFRELKEATGAADGNLSVHLRRLEEAGFITIRKSFANLRPQTTYTITELGRGKVLEYVELLEQTIRRE